MPTNESLLERLLPHWPGVLFRLRANGTLASGSARFADLTGLSPPACQHPAWLWQLVHEADREAFAGRSASCAKTPAGLSSHFRIRHPETGRVIHLAEFRQPCWDSAGNLEGFEGYWLDITRQKYLEQRASSLYWKELLGAVALGFTHDFNNLLTGILSLSDAYLAQLDPQQPVGEGLALIKQNAGEASQLVQRLANLYQAQQGPCGYHDLNTVTADTLLLLRRVISRRIDLVSDLATTPLPLYVDAVQLRQTIIALAFLAAETITERGQIVFQTSREERWPQEMSDPAPQKPAACLSVRYRGSGITSCSPGSSIFQTSAAGWLLAQEFAARNQGAVSTTPPPPAAESEGTLRLWLPESDFTEAETACQTGKTRSILLAGSELGDLSLLAGALRDKSHQVVIAEHDALELLLSGDYQFEALVVQAAPDHLECLDLLLQVRKLRLPLKRVVRLLAGGSEAIPPAIVSKADLILPAGLAPKEVPDKLAALWD
jgi:hypothetical protein